MAINDYNPISVRTRLSPEVRRAQIVTETRKLFCDRGYSGFSLREVARACAINLSTVQHYFSTKEALIAEMVDVSVNNYTISLMEIVKNLDTDPVGQLISTIEYLISINNEPSSAKFFINLWSYARDDKIGTQHMNNLYSPIIDWVKKCIRRIRPHGDDQDIAVKASLIMSTADGLLCAEMLSNCYFRNSTKPTARQYAEKIMEFYIMAPRTTQELQTANGR